MSGGSRVILGYVLVLTGILWVTFAGLCQGMGVLMTLDAEAGRQHDWLKDLPRALWLLPGVGCLIGARFTRNAGRSETGLGDD